ncbi:MAG TPA: DUF1501 domain-containing protein [Gammaproteobacteria bacterium]
MLDRRELLLGAARLTLLAPCWRLALAAAPTDARFVLVILRGGLDGLAAVPPYGEPRYRALRGPLALDAPGGDGAALKLDGLFALHPSLATMHRLYGAGELAIAPAVATPYRERSHFDAQDVLEGGGAAPRQHGDGWLNRALAALAAAGAERDAVALAERVPLVLRGTFVASGWTATRLPAADEDTLERALVLYEAVDPPAAARLQQALATRALAARDDARGGQLPALMAAAGRFLAAPGGPRVAVLEAGGWDTHANQGAAQGRLAARLRGLDAGLAELARALGEEWRRTAVAVVTEFGRTAAVNGTRGTDHGTAGAAFLAGGAVAGGRILGEWPGLGPRDLLDGRDLRPALDLRSIFKGLLAGLFALGEPALEGAVFPNSAAAPALLNLLRA